MTTTVSRVGASSRHLPDVQRICVVRPNAIGDFVFALPALAALRRAYPQARITLLGRRWHREFLRERPGPWDEVLEMPPVRGVGVWPEDPDHTDDAARIEAFVDPLRRRRFDIAIQLFGGGRYSNPFVRSLGARISVGLRAAGAEALDRWLPYDRWQNERLRLLEVVALAGAEPGALAPRLAVLPSDEAALRSAAPALFEPALQGRPVVVLQPGATDARRRWAVERFAAVGDALAREGAVVVINGGPDEVELTACLAALMRAPVIDLRGSLPLSGLAALLARTRLLVSNDTGPLHLAHALGTPAVGIYWAMNFLTAQPLVMGPQRALISGRVHCPVCGAENFYGGCGHAVSFVDDVVPGEVLERAFEVYRSGREPPGPPGPLLRGGQGEDRTPDAAGRCQSEG